MGKNQLLLGTLAAVGRREIPSAEKAIGSKTWKHEAHSSVMFGAKSSGYEEP